MSNSQIRVLIADESTNFGVSCAAALRQQNYYAVTRRGNGKRLLNEIPTLSPDVVVIDVFLDDMEFSELVTAVRSLHCKQPTFILTTSGSDPTVAARARKLGINTIIFKPIEARLFVERIANALPDDKFCLGMTENRLEIVVTQAILQLGVPAHLNGYAYIRYAIIAALNDTAILKGVTKQLYPEIARKFHTTAPRVERSIRHAIETSWDRGNVDVLNNVFGYSVDSMKGKPTNTEFISLVTDRIRLQYSENKPVDEPEIPLYRRQGFSDFTEFTDIFLS